MSGKAFAAVMAVLGVIALLAFGVFERDEAHLEVGDAVPVAELELLDGGPEATASLADYRGQYVLLNAWASWCDPCRDETPDLVKLQKTQVSPNFTVIGVQTQDASEDGLDFAQEFGMDYPSIRDGSGDYADELGMTGVPESILVDPEGNAAYIWRGPITEDQIQSTLLPLIEDGA